VVLLSLIIGSAAARAQAPAPAGKVAGGIEAVDTPAVAGQGGGLSPLAPAPTGSPRETFASFRALSRSAQDLLLQAFDLSAEDGTLFDSPEVMGLKDRALDQLNRAASTLDLSAVPPANRGSGTFFALPTRTTYVVSDHAPGMPAGPDGRQEAGPTRPAYGAA